MRKEWPVQSRPYKLFPVAESPCYRSIDRTAKEERKK
jgi:hypothetical protein